MSTRHAVSLVELLVLMSASSVILTMSAALVHRAMRTQSESRGFFDAERSAMRLARQIRRDTYDATAALVGGEGLGDNVALRLQLADQRTAEYSYADGEVLRILTKRDGAVSREQFAFPSPIELDVRKEDSPPRIVLTITAKQRGLPRAYSKPMDLHVEAGLNRAPNRGAPQ